MRAKGLSDEKMADRIGVSRETVWKWRKERGLKPDKLRRLAHELDMEPEEFFRPPGQESVDALLVGVEPELRDTVVDVVKRMVKKG